MSIPTHRRRDKRKKAVALVIGALSVHEVEIRLPPHSEYAPIRIERALRGTTINRPPECHNPNTSEELPCLRFRHTLLPNGFRGGALRSASRRPVSPGALLICEPHSFKTFSLLRIHAPIDRQWRAFSLAGGARGLGMRGRRSASDWCRPSFGKATAQSRVWGQ